MSSAKARWQEGAGKAGAAAAAAAFLQKKGGGGGPGFGRQNTVCDVPESQIRRAKGAFVGLFLLMVTVWSTILISAIFSLRVNRDGCENCPDQCTCRGSPPAWG